MWRGRNWPWHVRSWTARPSRQREDVSDRTGRVCLCQPRVIRITISGPGHQASFFPLSREQHDPRHRGINRQRIQGSRTFRLASSSHVAIPNTVIYLFRKFVIIGIYPRRQALDAVFNVFPFILPQHSGRATFSFIFATLRCLSAVRALPQRGSLSNDFRRKRRDSDGRGELGC